MVLHDIAPHRAIGMSIHAFLRNWLPLLVSEFVWLLVLLGVVVLVLGAGMVMGRAALLLWLPVVLAETAVGLLSTHTCYHNIWTNLPMK